MDASMLEGSTSLDLMKPERPAQWPNPKLGSILVWIDEITSFLYPKAALERRYSSEDVFQAKLNLPFRRAG